MNELLVAWYLWVNGNYDVLIMTITLLVVGGLVLEVIRLNKRAEELFDYIVELWGFRENTKLRNEDQRQVNVHVAEDITNVQKKVDILGKVVGELKFKRKPVRK